MVCKFDRWPYVREDYAVWREVFEDILVGLDVPEPSLMRLQRKLNIFAQ